ncbi:MAG: alkaline phosphatase [Deltaproteobacteria bacterium]|nr:MAG: alkaline phosphatase [Deltaproteobacteria bacterium]
MRVSSLLLLAACTAPRPIPEPIVNAGPPHSQVRNLILFIGDGMGPQQVGFLDLYARRAPGSPFASGAPAMMRLAEQGMSGFSATDPGRELVVDSACSATQLALGLPSLSEVIGLDVHGEPQPTILQRAEAKGLWTGLVSDTRLTHATPASFAAHQPHRSMEDEIAVQMLASGAEVLLSGGLRHFAPQGGADLSERYPIPYPTTATRRDELDLLKRAEEQGYQLAFDRQSLREKAQPGQKLLGLFASSGMTDAITVREKLAATDEPTLREMTIAALDVLESSPEGFFLMVEGGQIDWAAHANDTGWMLHELLRLDAAVDAAMTWAADRDDTLIVVTADHETGGFGVSYSMFELPEPVELPGAGFADRPYQPSYDFGKPERLDAIANQRRPLFALLDEHDGGTAEALVALTTTDTAFPLTLTEAQRVLSSRDNPHHRPEGPQSRLPQTMPNIQELEAYYPAGERARTSLLARTIAHRQGVTWATGTHTHTPVPVLVWGPEPAMRRLTGWRHHAELGARMQEILLDD